MMWGVSAWAQQAWSQLTGFGVANRISAFNFCDPFDHILPVADGTVSALDRQHLWGMYAGIAAGAPAAVSARLNLPLLGVG